MHSRNLAAFLLPDESPWMRAFLNSPLYAHASHLPHGIPHPLFDGLQVCLSHLLLSLASPMAHAVSSDRGNYDLQRVYNWNQPFATLYMRLPNEEPEPEFRSPLFPNLPSPSPGVKCQYNLNMHTLLHIRNFWHHHFVDEPTSAYSIAPREGTYADMAKTLASHGITAKNWDGPIQQPEVGGFQGKWTGHYSCLHLWPKKREELEEEQSFAVNWATVDPLVSLLYFTHGRTKGYEGRTYSFCNPRLLSESCADDCLYRHSIAPRPPITESLVTGQPSSPRYRHSLRRFQPSNHIWTQRRTTTNHLRPIHPPTSTSVALPRFLILANW